MTNNVYELSTLILKQYPGMDLNEAIEQFQKDARDGKFGATAQDYQTSFDTDENA
jgi:hypothetical protein